MMNVDLPRPGTLYSWGGYVDKTLFFVISIDEENETFNCLCIEPKNPTKKDWVCSLMGLKRGKYGTTTNTRNPYKSREGHE